MDHIEELIRYHHESDYLDFKIEEYKDTNKPNLIKDVLAMANAHYSGDRYIIIGVKKAGSEIRIAHIENAQDSAAIQQLIHANISPEVNITYEPYLFEDKNLMVLTIKNPIDQPYSAIKEMQVGTRMVLRKNEMWIRKGSYQLLINRSDLDRIYENKFKLAGLDGLVRLSFENDTNALVIDCIRNINLPSEEEKTQIEEQIHWKEDLLQTNPKKYTERFNRHRGMQTSYSEMDLPSLRERLGSVKMNYSQEDKYYLYEARAFKLNLVLNNSGQQHLEQAYFELAIPVTEGLVVMNQIVPNTLQQVIVSSILPGPPYPEVTEQVGKTIITQNLGDIRHKLPTKVFKNPLRIYPGIELEGKTIKTIATIYAANLLEPQKFELAISFR